MKKEIEFKGAALLLIIIASVFSQTKSDYFIVTDPSIYTIYSQYEQPVTPAEKAEFAAFTPFRIIDQDVALGDQITHALKFELSGKTFFLLKGDRNAFAGEKSRAGRQTIKGCEAIEDTVEVVGGGLRYTTAAGKSFPVEKGARVRRIFRSGGRFYIAAGGVYGWSSLEPRSAWRKSSARETAPVMAPDTGMTAELKNRITARFSSANESYKRMFSHFNTFTGDEKSIPQWRCDFTAGRCRCTLSGPYKTGDQLAESTAALSHDLDNLLLGTSFKARQGDSEIVIEKR